jgi:uncharacterized repeat protein (TIGR03803 family)
MRTITLGKKACIVFLLWTTTALATPAQSFFSLHSFDQTDGDNPYAGLIQGRDGKFYGMTSSGGANGYGNVYSITANGAVRILHSFDALDGGSNNIQAGLVLGPNGIFYGTTVQGGTSQYGTIFSITEDGIFTTLHTFCTSGFPCPDGASPHGALFVGTNRKLYGTTSAGGANSGGTFFTITASGTLTILHSFNGFDGRYPYGNVIEGTDGMFYGTTESGGQTGYGTVFRATADGNVTTLVSFNYANGADPEAGLIQGADGNFYGTTPVGGATGYGTVFKITPHGALTVIYSFCSQANCADGNKPLGGLVQGTDGNYYGTTFAGGSYLGNLCAPYGCGTLFRITSEGTLKTLHTFDSTDGSGPYAGLVQATSGKFYGTTFGGGGYNGYPYGTVFSLGVANGLFVEANPSGGKAGSKVIILILGTKLTGATSVSFNGTPSAFMVKSKSEITTTVPAGATTGTVQVVTPGGTLSSNVPFRVTP